MRRISGAGSLSGSARRTIATILWPISRSTRLTVRSGAMVALRLLPAVFAAVLVAGLAWFDGGFFPPAWGVASLGLLGVCGTAITWADRLALSRLALASLV